MAIKRRRYGKSGWGYTVDGKRAPGVTKILGMMPKDNLIKWAAESTGDYAVNNWGRLSEIPPADRLKELYGSRFLKSDPAAKRGTEVHRYAADLAEDRLNWDRVPGELRGYVEAYQGFLDTMEVRALVGAAELVVASRTLSYCGTTDLIADLSAVTVDGETIPPGRWLLDLKTSGKGIYSETALQTCAYKNAEVFVDPADPEAEERPMGWLQIEHCGAVWIKSDDWELRPLDTGPLVWEVFKTLRWLYDRQEEDMPLWVSGPAIVAELAAQN